MFQSTPVIANGRILLKVADDATDEYLFQSTPVIANGRIAGEEITAKAESMFQSTPVIANGRIASRASV